VELEFKVENLFSKIVETIFILFFIHLTVYLFIFSITFCNLKTARVNKIFMQDIDDIRIGILN